MQNKNLLKKILVIGVIIFLIGTSSIQGKRNYVSQKTENDSLENNIYMPYLEIVLINETKIFAPTDDTYISNTNPFEINGDIIVLAVQNRYGASDTYECDVLIKFDLSSIPPSTPIISASLNLYYYEYIVTNPAGRPLTVYKITSDWHEMTVNYNTKPLKTTNVSASANVPGSFGMEMSWNLTNDVQQYVDNPGINFGWEIMDETYWGGYDVPATHFYSKEYIPPGPPFTPYLKVELANETKIFAPTDDTYISNTNPFEINGDLIVLAVQNRYGASDTYECDVLIKFDLSSIPPSTPIISASLNLYYYEYIVTNPAGRPLTVYKITRDWDEGRVNYNRRPSKAVTISASEKVPNSVGIGMSWNLTNDVQQYVDNPGINFGWEIMDETYWGNYYVPATHFFSKEFNASPPPSYFLAFIFGRITNKVIEKNVITFEAVKTRVIYFAPVTVYTFSSNEKITIEKMHIGWVGRTFVFTLCKVSPIYLC